MDFTGSTFKPRKHVPTDVRNHFLGLRDHRLGFRNHRFGICNRNADIDDQLGLKGD